MSRISNFKFNFTILNDKCLKSRDKKSKIKKSKKIAFSTSILRHLLHKLTKTDIKFRFSDKKLGYKYLYRQFQCYLLPLFFQDFLDDPFFIDFKFLIFRKWTVMFRNRNFWLQSRISWISVKNCDHQRRNSHFFDSPCIIPALIELSAWNLRQIHR